MIADRPTLLSACLPGALGLAWLLFSALAHAEFRPFSAHYELLLNKLPVGSQSLGLHNTGEDNRFHFQAEIKPSRLGKLFRNDSRTESSNFTWDKGIISERYRLIRKGDNSRYADLTFDWSKQQVVNDVDGERWRMPIPDGTLDKLNVQLALMHDLSQGKRDLSYQIADGGRLKQYRFKVMAEQTIHTAGTKFTTLKIVRIRNDQDRITYLWCARELDFLPVQIQQTEHQTGHNYLSKLTKHRFLE